MLEKIMNAHKEMMYKFIDLMEIDTYELSWICFMKGVLITTLLFWIF
tara:strand:- start:405 stop:545 length:141 start_codon:yes stop_codon:yes gene_type:complete